MGRREYLIALATTLLAVSCYGSNADPDPTCLDGGGGKPIAIPNDTTVAVGDQFNLFAGFSGSCQEARRASTIWRTSDTSLIKLEPTTGHVTALKIGDAFVVSDLGGDARIKIR